MNIEKRCSKAYGIVSEILAILKEVPLGKYEIEAGLRLRNAWFLNGILTNCEVWYGLKQSDIDLLQEIYEYLLRKMLKAHSKTPKESL